MGAYRTYLRFRVGLLVLCSAALCTTATNAHAQAGPVGPTILTISGDIPRSNRGAVDPFLDKLAAAHGLKFERAMSFDTAALERLGMKTVTAKYDSWSSGHRFEGPLLRDVIAAVGVTQAGVLRPMAVDGYSPEIPFSDIVSYPVILALKMDGKWLGIGDAGPAWIIYPRQDFPALANEDDAKWVWSVYHIAVETKRPN